MKERFEGEGRGLLLERLARQAFAGNDAGIAAALAEAGTLAEFKQGEKIVVEGGEDNDVYFIVAGTVAVVIKGQEIRTLSAGSHFGEMAAIEPSQKRSATVIAEDTVVALKISGPKFVELCDRFPITWKPIARELGHRLFDRNRLMNAPNDRPRLFIISSAEALNVAHEVASGLERDVLATVWTNGVFWVSHYPLESLETAVASSDFAVAVAMFEDTVKSRGKEKRALRDNVLFELGLFMGRLGRRRTFLLHPRLPDLVLPSDLHGLTPVDYEPVEAKDLPSAISPACHKIRRVIQALGVKTGAS